MVDRNNRDEAAPLAETPIGAEGASAASEHADRRHAPIQDSDRTKGPGVAPAPTAMGTTRQPNEPAPAPQGADQTVQVERALQAAGQKAGAPGDQGVENVSRANPAAAHLAREVSGTTGVAPESTEEE
ncbi:MAG TPA: hypothetical protein VEI97_19435 [bacterium]|nr:hypothetical protein [bacterium]